MRPAPPRYASVYCCVRAADSTTRTVREASRTSASATWPWRRARPSVSARRTAACRHWPWTWPTSESIGRIRSGPSSRRLTPPARIFDQSGDRTHHPFTLSTKLRQFLDAALTTISCDSNSSDSPHRRRPADNFIVFARWRQSAPRIHYMIPRANASLPQTTSIGSSVSAGLIRETNKRHTAHIPCCACDAGWWPVSRVVTRRELASRGQLQSELN